MAQRIIRILRDISKNHNPNLKEREALSLLDEFHENRCRCTYEYHKETKEKGELLRVIKKNRKYDFNILKGNKRTIGTDM